MQVDLYGLTMQTPGVTFYLWSPWRCSAVEHRLFDAVRTLPGAEFEQAPDELQIHIEDARAWTQAPTPTTQARTTVTGCRWRTASPRNR